MRLIDEIPYDGLQLVVGVRELHDPELQQAHGARDLRQTLQTNLEVVHPSVGGASGWEVMSWIHPPLTRASPLDLRQRASRVPPTQSIGQAPQEAATYNLARIVP